jgi:hypothetical protein
MGGNQMMGTSEKTRKILVNEDKLLGVRCIGTMIGTKIGVKHAR